MCGFAGLIDGGARPAELGPLARRMADVLRARGPDDDGLFVDERVGLAMGFRRLSIRDLSATGHQPMASQDGRFVIVYNGEIYNLDELRASLPGLSFRGTSDTEVLLEAIARHGLETTLPRLDAMFALAVWDRETHELTLARDRLGEKPLYFGTVGAVFYFGSQPGALRADPRFRPALDEEAIADYVRFGYVPAPRSIYRDLHKLEAGGTARFAPATGTLHRSRWWSPLQLARPRPSDRMDERAAVDEVESRLSASVRRRMVSDVPLGAFLSGGIDSSLVVALAARHTRRLETFSIGFEEPDLDEAPFARAIASHIGTQHHELVMTSADAQTLVPELPRIYDEPFADSSQLPTRFLAALARKHVTVAVSGDGGDELFAGYTRYADNARRWHPWRERVSRRLSPLAPLLSLLEGGLAYAGEASRGLPRRVLLRGAREAASLRPPFFERSYREMVTHWRPTRVLRHASERATFPWSGLPEIEGLAPVDRMQVLDLCTYLPDDILVKVDRATMAVSLEARTPFLAPDVMELAWRLPGRCLVRGPATKWVLREALARHVPRTLFERPKMGFGAPIASWLRGPLRSWADDLLEPGRLRRRGLWNVGLVSERWREHVEGRAEWHYPLWVVLMLEAWLDTTPLR